PNEKLFERHPAVLGGARRRAKPESARTEPADRAGSDFQHPYASRVKTKFRVHRTVMKPERASRLIERLNGGGLPCRGQPRRRDIDRLFKDRPRQRVGLVEDGENP